MFTKPYSADVYSHERGDFRSVTHKKVLIYFPHGFGDWVQFGYIVRLLESSNEYFITRFGDDNVSVFDGSPIVNPIYTGQKSPHCLDGGAFGLHHFGVEFDEIDGGEKVVQLPLPVYDACVSNGIEVMLWHGAPETWGYVDFPFHTKPRCALPRLAPSNNLDHSLLGSPLPPAIDFSCPKWLLAWTEARLKSSCGYGERKLCILGRTGYTTIEKNWGYMFRDEVVGRRLPEGEECRDFMRAMLRKDPNWMFLAMEDRMFSGDDTVRDAELNCYSYAELFGTPDQSAPPFGLMMKALGSLADLAVGVPAGPYHFCMAKPGLPTIGIWIEHFPSWYDEPKQASVHVVSRHLKANRADQRPGTFASKADLHYRIFEVDTNRITGEQVFAAYEELMC